MSVLFVWMLQYKSSVYEIARGLLRSRNKQADRADRLAAENQALIDANADLHVRLKQCQEKLQVAQQI